MDHSAHHKALSTRGGYLEIGIDPDFLFGWQAGWAKPSVMASPPAVRKSGSLKVADGASRRISRPYPDPRAVIVMRGSSPWPDLRQRCWYRKGVLHKKGSAEAGQGLSGRTE